MEVETLSRLKPPHTPRSANWPYSQQLDCLELHHHDPLRAAAEGAPAELTNSKLAARPKFYAQAAETAELEPKVNLEKERDRREQGS